ncbi:MSHA biogenesis protein MshB [Pseudohongiella nitratireducens]|jgi:prepilin-type N-terminal cleavage/methylation domain-containing protein|uniref:MSHA biogenesis protein MshB n=1 Tax=Pseudohongiella nitratireducens TaxID=1768907 RepID=A0A917LPW9_9GAMM|nr:type II secretion system protein [Pseudohongiella nitratireducens]GGG49950.1 MSHA biogenesis protein MshB [Pseudohongiella nitratireducens]
MNIQLKAKRQDGFTIIELVVVILLLGILAATALPRFMDVTDEAHDAVVEGVVGGLNSGSALFRATWVATGQSTTAAVDYPDGSGTLYANSNGYPIGDATTIDATACADIFDTLLQSGHPDVAAGGGYEATVGDYETLVEAVSNSTNGTDQDADFVAINNYAQGDAVADTTSCSYFYVGQFKEGTSTTAPAVTIPQIDYSLTTGDVTLQGTELALNTD